ncbi:MAG: hypothetical protein JRJ39_08190, partial [Deltaproteobacteria bacterium]|nr:hypothetical protein [Deltaproteobacteria bacterium]
MTKDKSPLSGINEKDLTSQSEDFFRLWRIPFNNETEPSKLIIALRERIKEL